MGYTNKDLILALGTVLVDERARLLEALPQERLMALIRNLSEADRKMLVRYLKGEPVPDESNAENKTEAMEQGMRDSGNLHSPVKRKYNSESESTGSTSSQTRGVKGGVTAATTVDDPDSGPLGFLDYECTDRLNTAKLCHIFTSFGAVIPAESPSPANVAVAYCHAIVSHTLRLLDKHGVLKSSKDNVFEAFSTIFPMHQLLFLRWRSMKKDANDTGDPPSSSESDSDEDAEAIVATMDALENLSFDGSSWTKVEVSESKQRHTGSSLSSRNSSDGAPPARDGVANGDGMDPSDPTMSKTKKSSTLLSLAPSPYDYEINFGGSVKASPKFRLRRLRLYTEAMSVSEYGSYNDSRKVGFFSAIGGGRKGMTSWLGFPKLWNNPKLCQFICFFMKDIIGTIVDITIALRQQSSPVPLHHCLDPLTLPEVQQAVLLLETANMTNLPLPPWRPAPQPSPPSPTKATTKPKRAKRKKATGKKKAKVEVGSTLT